MAQGCSLITQNSVHFTCTLSCHEDTLLESHLETIVRKVESGHLLKTKGKVVYEGEEVKAVVLKDSSLALLKSINDTSAIELSKEGMLEVEQSADTISGSLVLL